MSDVQIGERGIPIVRVIKWDEAVIVSGAGRGNRADPQPAVSRATVPTLAGATVVRPGPGSCPRVLVLFRTGTSNSTFW